VAKEFEKQLKEKSRLMKNLNEQLDSRIANLNALLNRADHVLSAAGKNIHHPPRSEESRHHEILNLAKQGQSTEEIAHRLAVPKEEVRFILGLRKQQAQARNKEEKP
jgi:DNA-binding NarL/FixJ family response regulator